jgi:hypothetical protein
MIGATGIETSGRKLPRGQTVANKNDDAKMLLHDPDLEVENSERDENQQTKKREQLVPKLHRKMKRRFKGALPELAMLESSDRACGLFVRWAAKLVRPSEPASGTLAAAVFAFQPARRSPVADCAAGRLPQVRYDYTRRPGRSGNRDVVEAWPEFSLSHASAFPRRRRDAGSEQCRLVLIGENAFCPRDSWLGTDSEHFCFAHDFPDH